MEGEGKMTRRFSYMFVLLSIALAVISCQAHDPFYFSNNQQGAQVGINVDWSEFNEDEVSGMSLVLFPSMSQSIRHTTSSINHVELNLLPDEYTLLVHNQGVSEFGTIGFSGMSQLSTAKVFPERCSSDWYRPRDNEVLVLSPEWLAFGKNEFLVTEDMVKDDGSYYEPKDIETPVAIVTPKNIIYTLHVSINVKGINNYRAGRAAISGMADGYFPGTEEYNTQCVTHLIESWKAEKTYSHPDGVQDGIITSEITCFGLPAEHNSDSMANVLNMNILLVDNETVVNHTFNVGDKFYKRTADGSSLHIYLDLQLPNQLPDVPNEDDSGQSVFDAEVDEWGEEESTEVIL